MRRVVLITGASHGLGLASAHEFLSGGWRVPQKVKYRYLDCGDLRNGFARVKCKNCRQCLFSPLGAFIICPSCYQKRMVEFGEWLCIYTIRKVPHRQFVFIIQKIFRWVSLIEHFLP
jgi:ribosomal protein S27E